MVLNAPLLKSNEQQVLDEKSQTSQKLSSFVPRHIGPNSDDIQQMLKVLGFSSLDALINQTVPQAIRLKQPLKLPEAESEYAALAFLKKVAAKNQVFRSYIGMGYYDSITPPVIGRSSRDLQR